MFEPLLMTCVTINSFYAIYSLGLAIKRSISESKKKNNQPEILQDYVYDSLLRSEIIG
jgi:hypothetical protein